MLPSLLCVSHVSPWCAQCPHFCKHSPITCCHCRPWQALLQLANASAQHPALWALQMFGPDNSTAARAELRRIFTNRGLGEAPAPAGCLGIDFITLEQFIMRRVDMPMSGLMAAFAVYFLAWRCRVHCSQGHLMSR